MTLWVVPEGLAAASAAVETMTVRLAAVQGAVAPPITAVVSAAADPMSLQSAVEFSAAATEHAAVAAQGVDELGCSGFGVGKSGASYAARDAAAAASYLVVGS